MGSVQGVQGAQAVAAAAGVVVLVTLLIVISHNRFVEQRQAIGNAWSNVDTELRRRYDLIPNVVRTVQAYATHEREVFEAVVQARQEAVDSVGEVAAQAGTEDTLVRSLKSLLALSESYPDLKADAHFLELQQELAMTEDRIQAARRIFNADVRELNQRVQSIPSNVIARLFGFHRSDYFELDAVIRDAGPPSVAPGQA